MENQLIDYSITDAAIQELHANYDGMDATKDYEGVKKAIAACRKLRTSVEKKRKELVADAVKWQKAVNTEAKRVTGLIAEVEDPLKDSKQLVDDEKERLRLEEERRKKEEEDRARQEELNRIQEEKEELARQKREMEEERRKLEELRKEAEPEPECPDVEVQPDSIETSPASESPTESIEPMSDDDVSAIGSWLHQCLGHAPQGVGPRAAFMCDRICSFLSAEMEALPAPKQKPITI